MVLLLGMATSLWITIAGFGWVFTGVRNITGLGIPGSILAFTAYTLLFNGKILLLFLLNVWLKPRLPEYPRLLFLFLGGDILLYQLFPWYWGNLFAGGEIFLRFAAVLGVHGVSLAGFTLAYLGFHLADGLWKNKSGFSIKKILLMKREGWITGGILAIPLILFIHSEILEYRWKATAATAKNVTLGLVQTSIPIGREREKDNRDYIQNSMELAFNYAVKILMTSPNPVDLLVFPESSIPFHTTNQDFTQPEYMYSRTFHGIMSMVAYIGKTSVLYNETDFVHTVKKNPDGTIRKLVDSRNSLTLMNPALERVSVYQKKHLLPFGEYIPSVLEEFFFFRRMLPEAGNFTSPAHPPIGHYDVLPSREGRITDPKSIPMEYLQNPDELKASRPPGKTERHYFVATLCYEAMFPEYVRSMAASAAEGKPVEFILNPVNDAWFGNGVENYQHLNSARFRAVENGLHLVRPALSGVSVVVDPTGKNVSRVLHPGERGIITATIPAARLPGLFLLWGTFPVYLVLAGIFIFAWRALYRRPGAE